MGGGGEPRRRGYYNPVDCALLDHIVEAAEQTGIYLQLCLITRDAYMGDLKDEQSAAYQQATVDAQNLLRYAVARWGYSTHVVTWEYFNENDPGLPMERFYREVGDYLQQVDRVRSLAVDQCLASGPRAIVAIRNSMWPMSISICARWSRGRTPMKSKPWSATRHGSASRRRPNLL